MDWDNNPEGNNTGIYVDLFTNDIDEFNFKLRQLLFRLNGFIHELKNIPDYVISELKRFINYLDENTLEISQGQINCIDNSIAYLEEQNPRVWQPIFKEPIVRKSLKKFLNRNQKWLIGIFVWLVIISMFYTFILTVDIGIDNNAKFTSIIAIMIGTALFLLESLKKR